MQGTVLATFTMKFDTPVVSDITVSTDAEVGDKNVIDWGDCDSTVAFPTLQSSDSIWADMNATANNLIEAGNSKFGKYIVVLVLTLTAQIEPLQ